MQGHLVQRGKRGVWYVYFDLPREQGQQREQHGVKLGTMPKTHAQARMRELLREVDDGTWKPQRCELTVEQLIDAWLEAKSDLATNTHVRYTGLMKRHVIPRIGKKQAAKVTPDHLRQVYKAVEEAGLSQQTKLHVHRALHTAFQYGVQEKGLTENVVSRIKAPRVERGSGTVISRGKVQNLIDTAKGTRLEVPVMLAALTGLRRGELLALKWDRINFERGTLYVAEAVEHTRRHGIRFKMPKSHTSRRVVPLAAECIELLQRHKINQDAVKKTAGDTYCNLGLVVPNPDGSPWPPDSFSVQFARLARTAGCQGFRLHDLRHAFATLTLADGVSIRDVSDMLGHSSKAFTLATYAHAMEPTGRAAVSNLARTLLRAEVA